MGVYAGRRWNSSMNLEHSCVCLEVNNKKLSRISAVWSAGRERRWAGTGFCSRLRTRKGGGTVPPAGRDSLRSYQKGRTAEAAASFPTMAAASADLSSRKSSRMEINYELHGQHPTPHPLLHRWCGTTFLFNAFAQTRNWVCFIFHFLTFWHMLPRESRRGI